MALGADVRKNVKHVWEFVKSHEEALGAEALFRLFSTKGETKILFPGKDLSEGSAFLRSHGKKVMSALTSAVDHIDDNDGTLSALSDEDARELMVHPAFFPQLATNILEVLGIRFKQHMTPPAHSSIEKFLATFGSLNTIN